MDVATKGQVTRSAADIYEEFFVPALFAEWAPRVTSAANVAQGQKILDVACGTGVLTREIRRRLGSNGTIIGLDCNEGMLAVARRWTDGIEWRLGQAEALPFSDNSFDAVVSQFGLMFFEDRPRALAEMWRVLRRGGRLAVAVWGALDSTPGYADMTALLQRLFGAEVAGALRAPYCLGDRNALQALFAEGGIEGARIHTLDGMAQFPSIESWVNTDVKGWTLADRIDDAQYRTLQEAAQRGLRHHATADGTVQFLHPAHIVSATKE